MLVEPLNRCPYYCIANQRCRCLAFRVLDLGCGTGRDCFVCSALVGEKGFVTGIDMTPGQLSVAEKHLDQWTQTMGYAKPNIKFVQGEIEQLGKAGIPDASIDVIISNCVINLSPDKASVLKVQCAQ